MSSQSFQYSFRGKDRTWTLRTNGVGHSSAAADDVQSGNRVQILEDPQIDSGVKKWTTKQLMRLLRLYRAHSCLWDTSDPDNRNRKLRKAALIDIAQALGNGAAYAQISQKIQILRATYRHEKVCIKQRIRKGMGARTKLKWFSLAHSFLKNLYPLDYDKKEDAENHSSLQDAVVRTIDPETDDEYLQSEDVDIKMEPEVEDPKSTSSDDYYINNSASTFKSEENSMEGEYVLLENLDEVKKSSSENATLIPSALTQHLTQTNLNPIPTDKLSISNNVINRQNLTISPTKLIVDDQDDNLLEGKWPLRHSVKFLRLYGAHPCLWDLADEHYRSREMRNAALEDIAAAMGYGLNTDYVTKKIKIFRITYMQHRKRMIEDIKQNREPDVKLRWFPLADCFLRSHIGLRSIKKQERELPQFDYQYVYTNLNLIDPDLLTDFTIDSCLKY